MSNRGWFHVASWSAVAMVMMFHSSSASALTLSGTPAKTVNVGSPYYFRPTITGRTSSTSFHITGKPGWASFSSYSGTLQGTPTTASTWSNINITVSDGTNKRALPAFAITSKAATTTAVKISGTPATKSDAGAYYSFRPTVTAPSGAKLSFTITNKPSWAAFSSATGSLTGTPSATTVATFSNIGIRVTDSKTSASLPAFSIAVTKPGTGAALLSWVKPTKNTDGSNLVNLAGFRVHYGSSVSALSKTVTVGGAGSTSASIEGLARGTWYFAVVAYTTAGIESAMSAAAAKTIN
jgi:hypothetical protein